MAFIRPSPACIRIFFSRQHPCHPPPLTCTYRLQWICRGNRNTRRGILYFLRGWGCTFLQTAQFQTCPFFTSVGVSPSVHYFCFLSVPTSRTPSVWQHCRGMIVVTDSSLPSNLVHYSGLLVVPKPGTFQSPRNTVSGTLQCGNSVLGDVIL